MGCVGGCQILSWCIPLVVNRRCFNLLAKWCCKVGYYFPWLKMSGSLTVVLNVYSKLKAVDLCMYEYNQRVIMMQSLSRLCPISQAPTTGTSFRFSRWGSLDLLLIEIRPVWQWRGGEQNEKLGSQELLKCPCKEHVLHILHVIFGFALELDYWRKKQGSFWVIWGSNLYLNIGVELQGFLWPSKLCILTLNFFFYFDPHQKNVSSWPYFN